MEQITTLQVTGLLALTGTLCYAIGDVLLLASKVDLDQYPKLQPFIKLLSDAEKMVVLTPQRLTWGALIGVFATPLVMVGYWQVYKGLGVANAEWALATVSLFGAASVIGAFVHGTFYYMGEYVHALNNVQNDSQAIVADMIARHRKILIVTYAPVLLFILIASIFFSVLVASGKTFFPVWMTAVNPVTLTIAWMLLKRVLPQFIRDWTEGAGFNVAFFAFFTCTTITLWKV
jgi:hypothetical protein